MPRLTTINPNQASPEVRELFQGPLKGKEFNLFKALANSPAALRSYVAMTKALSEGLLTFAEREVIALTVAETNGCGYCVAAHTALGKMAGLSLEQTVEARRGRAADKRLDALARFTAALLLGKGAVSDSGVNAFRDAGFTDGHIAEVVANISVHFYTNYFNLLNGTPVDFPAPPAI